MLMSSSSSGHTSHVLPDPIRESAGSAPDGGGTGEDCQADGSHYTPPLWNI